MGKNVNTVSVMIKPLEGGTLAQYLELIARETERGASRVPSLSEIVEVKARYCSQFLIGVDGERSELLRWRCRRYVFAGAAVQPMRPAVVDDRRMVGDALGRDAHDSAFEQLRERDTEASSSFD